MAHTFERIQSIFAVITGDDCIFQSAQKQRKKGIHYNNISKHLKAIGVNDVKLILLMIIDSAQMFSIFLLLFQNEKPMIHQIYQQLRNLVLLIAAKICKQVENSSECNTVFSPNNLMSLDEIKLPNVIRNRINELKKDKEHANVEIEFKELYKQHYLQAGTYLVDKINWNHIKCLQILSPTYLMNWQNALRKRALTIRNCAMNISWFKSK